MDGGRVEGGKKKEKNFSARKCRKHERDRRVELIPSCVSHVAASRREQTSVESASMKYSVFLQLLFSDVYLYISTPHKSIKSHFK